MTSPETLSPQQHRALTALLEHGTQRAAAKAARVSARSLRRWCDEATFAAELARQRTSSLSTAANILAKGSADAATALVEMASGEAPANPFRASAARAVIELAAKICELQDIGPRLAELEAAAATKTKPPAFGRGFS